MVGLQVAMSSQSHPSFKNRELIDEIVAQARPYEGRFGYIVVHHWWLGQYFAYAYRGPAEVVPLGMLSRTTAVRQGEMAAVLEDAASLRDDVGVLLIENDLARRFVDPDGDVLATLDARRPRLAEPTCHPTYSNQVGLLCARMVLFGPARRAGLVP